ncbi:hypothetical protein [Insolitispirillum peregrinum]|nr:hypothetical protein [Insolitispirillum peregrinum]
MSTHDNPVESLLAAMRSRMPWETAQKVLVSADLPRGRGWDQTTAKLLEKDWSAEEIAELTRLYKEHLLCGEKSVSFYNLSPESMVKLRDAVAKAEIEPGILTDTYPFPIEQGALEASKPSKPVLLAVEKDDDAIAVIFSSIRQVIIREEISFDDLPEETAEILSGFSEVIGLKKVKIQSFEVLWVPHEGNLVTVLVDCPRGLPQEGVGFIHACLQERFAKLFGEGLFEAPINLFPLIEALYKDRTQGNVVELAFCTTTASIKHEKMRRSGTCLRTEIYHKAGMQALNGEIEPFRISIEWLCQVGVVVTKPELSLNSRSELTLATNPILTAGVVRKCMGRLDFDAVRSKILPLMLSENVDAD